MMVMPMKNLVRTYSIRNIPRLYRHTIINRIFKVNCDSLMNIFTELFSHIPNFMIVYIFGIPIFLVPLVIVDKKKYHHNILLLIKELLGYGNKYSLDRSQHNYVHSFGGLYEGIINSKSFVPSMDMVVTPYFSYTEKKKLLTFLKDNDFTFMYNSIRNDRLINENPKKYFFMKNNFLLVNLLEKKVVITNDPTIIPNGNIYTVDDFVTRYKNHKSCIRIQVMDINVIIEQ